MLNIDKILCPVDFFPASLRAAHYAIALAQNYEAKLYLLHIEPHEDAMGVRRADVQYSSSQMENLRKKAKDADVAVDSQVRPGKIEEEVKRAIAKNDPGLLVMGTHGRHGIQKWLLGSVTEHILRHTSIP